MEEKNIERFRALFPILSSILTIGVLIFALFSLNDSFLIQQVSKFHFGMMFLFLSLSRIPLIIKAKIVDNKLLSFIKHICFGVFYLVIAVLIAVLQPSAVNYTIICSIFFFSIIINRVLICAENHKVFTIIFNTFLVLICLLLAVLPLAYLNEADTLANTIETSCIFVVMIVALVETLAFAFSSMQLKGIIKIMKKTYAFEVLYGLAVLIVASSFFFAIMEDSIPSFGDGLWYSFAIVTTIGLGDYTVTSIISRLLSVVLGLYGLVVVAVITSIIVNFYIDTKDKKEDKNDKDDKKDE